MKLTKEQFIQKTAELAENSGIELNEKQLNQLYIYKEMLLEWNEKINLTAIVDDESIISKHIIDSLEVVKYIKENQKIIDIGTGAGLPGIIIAIYFEGKIDITLFDALNKRILFLQEVINKLGLKNIQAVHGRAEEVSKQIQFREAYDVVVSRAVAKLNILMELTVPFVKLGGTCIYMKADKTKEELKEAKNAISVLGLEYIKTEEYTIAEDSELLNHTIIKFNKKVKTQEKYPRQFAKIKKNPL